MMILAETVTTWADVAKDLVWVLPSIVFIWLVLR